MYMVALSICPCSHKVCISDATELDAILFDVQGCSRSAPLHVRLFRKHVNERKHASPVHTDFKYYYFKLIKSTRALNSLLWRDNKPLPVKSVIFFVKGIMVPEHNN